MLAVSIQQAVTSTALGSAWPRTEFRSGWCAPAFHGPPPSFPSTMHELLAAAICSALSALGKCRPLWPPPAAEEKWMLLATTPRSHSHLFDSSQDEDRGSARACVWLGSSRVRMGRWSPNSGWRTQQHLTSAPVTGAAWTSLFIMERRMLAGPCAARRRRRRAKSIAGGESTQDHAGQLTRYGSQPSAGLWASLRPENGASGSGRRRRPCAFASKALEYAMH